MARRLLAKLRDKLLNRSDIPPMDQNQFTTVYNVLENTLAAYAFSLVGVLLTIVGLILVLAPNIFSSRKSLDKASQTAARIFGCVFFSIAALWTISTVTRIREQQREFRDLVTTGECRVVEGPVEHFVAMPREGHAYESFDVAGVRFMYSDFIETGAFNQTLAHGGPIKASSYVRICYDPQGNHILTLEIRNQ